MVSKIHNNGCSFGKVTRQMVEDIRCDIKEAKLKLDDISNHYSQRLPTWASIFFAFAGIIIGALLGIILS